jgi:hypothetical protein
MKKIAYPIDTDTKRVLWLEPILLDLDHPSVMEGFTFPLTKSKKTYRFVGPSETVIYTTDIPDSLDTIKHTYSGLSSSVLLEFVLLTAGSLNNPHWFHLSKDIVSLQDKSRPEELIIHEESEKYFYSYKDICSNELTTYGKKYAEAVTNKDYILEKNYATAMEFLERCEKIYNQIDITTVVGGYIIHYKGKEYYLNQTTLYETLMTERDKIQEERIITLEKGEEILGTVMRLYDESFLFEDDE